MSSANTPQIAEEKAPAPAAPRTDLDYSQWQVGPNGRFRPAARTVPRLPAGVYRVGHDDAGFFIDHQAMLCDDIIELPEGASLAVLEGMKTFWSSRELYARHGLLYKRGVLLYGPPGAGKTVAVHLLARELMRLDGIILICIYPPLCQALLQIIRTAEPTRPLIVVFEDIDEMIAAHGEGTILSMLDGETQVDNVVFVATTNYPGRLGARIANRPSRFDERILVHMPSENVRRAYLEKAASNGSALLPAELDKWVVDTDGFSIAHLRELVAAVLCLGRSYEDVLERLRHMNERPKDVDGYQAGAFGLAPKTRKPR